MATRRIPIEGLNNLRDLGGYALPAGSDTAWGRLLRSDSPHRLGPAQWGELAALGVRTLVDVRSTLEAHDRPIKAPEGFSYVLCPLMHEAGAAPGKRDALAAEKAFLRSMSLDYSEIMGKSMGSVARILSHITDGLRVGGVDFFCTAGKDRTGIVAACVLSLCGACDDDIVADYCVTEVYIEKPMRARLDAMPADALARLPEGRIEMLLRSRPETMRAFLAWLHGRDLPQTLCDHGFSLERQQELREALVCR